MSSLINIAQYFFFFLAFLLVFLIIFFSIISYFLKKYKDKENVYLYGLLLNFDRKQILSLSLIFIKFTHLIFLAFAFNLEIYSLVFILILSILFNIFNFKFIHLLLDICVCFVLYFILLSKHILISYCFDVEVLWYVILLIVLLSLFIIIASLFIFLKDFLMIMKKANVVDKVERYNIINDINNINKSDKIKKVLKKEMKVKKSEK